MTLGELLKWMANNSVGLEIDQDKKDNATVVGFTMRVEFDDGDGGGARISRIVLATDSEEQLENTVTQMREEIEHVVSAVGSEDADDE